MAESVYLIPKFHFEVSWASASAIICSEVSGLNVDIQPIEYRDGKSPEFYPTKRPGLLKFGDITVKRAVFQSDLALQDWYDKVVARDDAMREAVTIILKNDKAEAVITWTLENAWVSTYTMPDLNSTANEPAVEQIKIVCESIKQEFN